MAAGSARLLRPLILRDLLVALENAEIHNERLTGQCFLDPKSQKEEAPVPQPALKLQKNCCAASTKHLILALEEFRNLGIDFVSCQENNDTSSPLGGAIFTIIGAVTQTGARYHR